MGLLRNDYDRSRFAISLRHQGELPYLSPASANEATRRIMHEDLKLHEGFPAIGDYGVTPDQQNQPGLCTARLKLDRRTE
ncbi:hypothetical protein N7468_001296 [Penicillium chermesinum]|uniref:Uncharacterized protein n=1 Tax=Penicillium chermesinum TaxID=63820 RepID=A0A9W9PIK8_9EURO|nr:uncharacterized protein N7468_001296 [Penicillium chermesinum]KAJ5246313.1 hypothetical protein N7468_001296 [Penicillium chermesinum]